MSMENEHGLNANQLHNYCIYTLKRLFEELTLPAVTTNIDLMNIREAQREANKKEGGTVSVPKKEELNQDNSLWWQVTVITHLVIYVDKAYLGNVQVISSLRNNMKILERS